MIEFKHYTGYLELESKGTKEIKKGKSPSLLIFEKNFLLK